MRNWQTMELDEIFSIWKSFKITEALIAENKVPDRPNHKCLRLTPLEIFKLVDTLLWRLDKKERRDDV